MEIKELAQLIKETKKEYKQSQRVCSKIWLDGDYNSRTFYSQPEKWFQLQPFLEIAYKNKQKLDSYKTSFRIKHIVLSMCRGRSISQIESKVSQDRQAVLDRENIYNCVKQILSEMGKKWIN